MEDVRSVVHWILGHKDYDLRSITIIDAAQKNGPVHLVAEGCCVLAVMLGWRFSKMSSG
jgi:hypothetical protein